MQLTRCNRKYLLRIRGFSGRVLSKLKLTLFCSVGTIFLVIYTAWPLAYVYEPCLFDTITLCNTSFSVGINLGKQADTNISSDTTTSFDYDLRHLGFALSKEELDFVLNIRKLILFTIHELNKPLKHTGCVKWWANPLDLIFASPILISETHITHKIRFIVQPGNIIHLQVEIRQKRVPINIADTELEIVSPFKFLNTPAGIIGPCKNNESSEILRNTCLCLSHSEIAELEAATEAAMKIWNLMDPELPTWKPKDSYMIEDYMNFKDYEWFLKSPGNTTNEVRDKKFSSEYCGPNVNMLVMISSAPDHFNHRKIIRKTFASPENLKEKGIKVVFLMGIPANKIIKAGVFSEEGEFKDIIVADFVDSYHNLSLSHLAMYNWMQLTCRNGQAKEVAAPKYLLKADDDFFLNVDLALKVAEANPDAELIAGFLFCGTRSEVIRDTGNKYYTPRYMHFSRSYAGYYSGVAYLLRTDVIPRFLHMSITTPFIHMDDAYVTGILSRQIDIHPRNSKVFPVTRIEPDACKSKTVATSYVDSPEDMMAQWNEFVKPIPSNCELNNLPIISEFLNDGIKQKCFFD